MKIIIDTDIGDDIDDAFAIRLALNTPELEILGITTVFRNAVKRAKIVKALLDKSRRDLPVYAGEDRPLSQEINKLVYETTLSFDADGTVTVPHYSEAFTGYEVQTGAVDFLLSQAERYPGEITLVCIGPLTNVAKAYLKDGERFRKFKDILMMGGQAKGDYAEWNFRCDPEAAQIVFDSGVPIKMVGINVTKFCSLSEEEIEWATHESSPAGTLTGRMLEKWLQDNNYQKTPVMHDGLAISELTESFCKYETRCVGVATEGEKRAMLCEGKNPVEIAVAVDSRKFIGYMFNRLRRNV